MEARCVRCCRYLNNIVEQDHRAIKGRSASTLGLKSFRTAAITFAGVERANRIRKGQFSFGRGRQRGKWLLKQLWDRALAQLFNPYCSLRPRPRTVVNANSGDTLVAEDARHYAGPPGRPAAHGRQTATAGGLVFVGATNDKRSRAFDAKNCDEVWSMQLDAVVNANPKRENCVEPRRRVIGSQSDQQLRVHSVREAGLRIVVAPWRPAPPVSLLASLEYGHESRTTRGRASPQPAPSALVPHP